ncbi:ParA family protein [Streptomyces sp. Edi4]|uniref:ParA family protein n=1 Tax=Streptomyces sp. Edi4 TaxID=3162527 RepID=UPI0033065C09
MASGTLARRAVRRTAVLNNKGGIGKSTTAVRLAEALAKRGKRVLLVDMDPQGNATRRLGVRYEEGAPSISEAILANKVGAAAGVIRDISWDADYADRIKVCPAWLELEERMYEAGAPGSHLRLAKALQGADDDFDETVLDCPPSLFHLANLALAAAHQALIVTEAEQDSVRGAKRVRQHIADNKFQLHNDELELIGVIVSRMENTTPVDIAQLASIRTLFGDLVWDPIIPRIKLAKVADNNALPLAQVRGRQAGQLRAVFELLADTYEKRSVTV